MAEVTVVPDGDGTTLDLTPTTETDHFDEVDEGISGADDGTTTLSTTSTSDQADFLTLEEMPADFDTSIDRQITVRTQVSGAVDDTIQLSGLIFESDESTQSGGGSNQSGNHTWANASGSIQSDTSTKATWDTRKVRLFAGRTNSGMPDSVTSEFTAVEVVIDYNVAGLGADELIAARQIGGQQPVRETPEVVAY